MKALLVLFIVLFSSCGGAEPAKAKNGNEPVPGAAEAKNGKESVPGAAEAKRAAQGIGLDTWTGCALRKDGGLVCWGSRSGKGFEDEAKRWAWIAPRLVGQPEPVGFVQLAMNTGHGCARRVDGTVACWGLNEMGQVGDGTIEDRAVPVSVPGLSDVTEVVVGARHSCALKGDGTVRCWGSNLGAHLALETAQPVGNGPLQVVFGRSPQRPRFHGPNASLKPVAIQGLLDATALASRRGRTCAVVAGGEVFCWGASPSEVYKEHATPQPIEGLTHVTAIALGSGHSCAVHADGTASCWGANFFGQTGTGLDETYFEKPSKVIGLTDVAGIAANGHHTCAWRHDGSVDCWGDNSGGQLGVRNVSKTSTPTRVELPGKVVHVALSSQASCAMTADNRVWCWGHNKMGDIALGQGKEQALTPVDVTSHLNAAQPEIVPEPATPDPVCAQLLAHRGYTLARASCRLRKAELGLYSATVTGPDVPGGSDSRAAAVRDGVIAKDTGLDAFGAHMKALGIYRAKEVTGYEMLSLLDAFHALPRGMNPNSFGPLSSSRSFPEHFPKPGLVMQPFTLTLLLPKASTGGGGLGDSAPMWSAAILHGDAQYRFEWTLKDLGPG